MRKMKLPKLPEKKPESWQKQKILLAKAIVEELKEANKKLDLILRLLESS